MQQHEFEWTAIPFLHADKGIENTEHLATKALSVAHKHFFVPLSEFDLAGWSKLDHYRHHCSELDDNEGDETWIRPWLVGQWLGERECVLQFEPNELMEEALKGADWNTHKRGAIFGVYLTVSRQSEGWSADFAFRLDDRQDGDQLHDLPVKEALCLKINGDVGKVEEWLDWAYKQKA